MRAFIVSTRGDSLELAKKLIDEGWEINVLIRDKTRSRSLELESDVPLVQSPTPDMMNANLIIVEDRVSGKFADKARSLKRRVLGGGLMADRLFNDMDFNDRTMVGCGFELTKQNTNGIVTEVGGWFNGEKFLRPHFLGFKYYRLGTGDVGIVTPGMGIVGTYKIKSRLFNDILRKTETLFRSMNYKGYVGVEGLINNETFKAIKIHPGLVYPTVNLLTKIHTTWAPFLLKFVDGKAEVVAVQPDKVGVGISTRNGIERFYAGVGFTAEEAQIKAYKTINKANLSPDVYYRMDIGNSFESNMSKLKEWGWV